MPDDLVEPGTLKDHAADYRPDAWKEYAPAELGWWVALLLKRAGHRADGRKAAKDVHDAANYLRMLQAHVDAARARLP